MCITDRTHTTWFNSYTRSNIDLPLPECTRDNRVDPEIGKPYHRAGGYPPWTFLTVAPIVLPTPWHIHCHLLCHFECPGSDDHVRLGLPNWTAPQPSWRGLSRRCRSRHFRPLTGRSRLANTESLSMLCSLVFIGWCRNGGPLQAEFSLAWPR